MDLAEKYDWFTAQELTNMIAVSQSTPGPIGVNMATYHTIKCPHCKNVVEFSVGKPKHYGSPFRICKNCGHEYVGKAAPKVCPVCAHPRAYFEVRKENY